VDCDDVEAVAIEQDFSAARPILPGPLLATVDMSADDLAF
jgi:hypothetical protein